MPPRHLIALALVLSVSSLTGMPVITTFSADPLETAPGEPATLQWEVTDATSVTINGSPVEGSSLEVNPLVTTDYLLEASDGADTATATITVTVSNVPGLAPARGRFVEIVKHSPDTSLHIGEVEVFAFGVTPDRTEPDGTSTNDLVQAGNSSPLIPPTTATLAHGAATSVIDGDLESGAEVWTTATNLGVESRFLLDLGATHPIGEVRVWGRVDLCCEDRLQNFSVNVYADDGSGQPGTLVNGVLFPDEAPNAAVGPAELDLSIIDPGVRSFTVNRPLIAPEGSIVLSWEVSAEATEVLIDQGIGDVTALTDATGSGSIILDPGPATTTAYVLQVLRPSSLSTASLLVEVTDQPIIHSFTSDTVSVELGSPVELSWETSNVDDLRLDGADVTGTSSVQLTPLGTRNFLLEGWNDQGSVEKRLRVMVVAPGEPIISEFMADNRGDVTTDEDGDDTDWIELCNPGGEPAVLDGYYLTDREDELRQWRIPDVTIPPGGYLLIFASGKDRSDPASELHTNFSLNDGGEYLALVKPDGISIVADFHPEFPAQRSEVSYGVNPATAEEGYFLEPTPGAANGASFTGFVGDTTFSHDRGFYDEAIEVEITTDEPGAVIRYTTNGTEPTEVRGLIYTGPILVRRTTVLRAAGFKPGFVPTNVDTQTYIFPADVVRQRSMSTSITRHPTYGPALPSALQDIPSVSLVFIPPGSLTSNPPADISRAEVPCSVEFINFEAGSVQYDAGMARYGSYVTNFPKDSVRVTFRSEYGPSKLRFPVFEGHDYKIDPADEVDALDIRAGNHDMVARGAYMSNRFTDDSMLAMGNIAPHGRHVHIYLNGLYWGIYHLRERWNAAMLAEYFPGSEEDYEGINANNTGSNFLDGVVTDGTGIHWNRAKSLVRGPQPFRRAVRHIDYNSVIDFMLLWLSGNSESEFRAAGSVPMDVPFKFFMKDADGFLRSANRSVTHQGPIDFMQAMRTENSSDYRILLADRIHKHFFNDGALTPAKNIDRLRSRVNEIRFAFYAESARWGYRSPSDWQSYQNNLYSSHFRTLTQTMIGRFRSAGMYPTLSAPSFAQHGGTISPGYELVINAPGGQVYYTTDGSDPRQPGGLLSPTAILYDGPVTLENTSMVRSRVRSGNNWSAMNEALFALDSSKLVVSEIMYDPLPPPPPKSRPGSPTGRTSSSSNCSTPVPPRWTSPESFWKKEWASRSRTVRSPPSPRASGSSWWRTRPPSSFATGPVTRLPASTKAGSRMPGSSSGS